MSSILKYVYTLEEVAVALNLNEEQKTFIEYYTGQRKLQPILNKAPELEKFKPFIGFTKYLNRNYYIIPANIFDTYLDTGLLPEQNYEYTVPDVNKKEYWEYNSSMMYALNTRDNWEFALKYFREKDDRIETEDIWNIFLAGCARMNYYQETETDINQRIKYAIMEYMIRRPQFFSTDDFTDNPSLHKK